MEFETVALSAILIVLLGLAVLTVGTSDCQECQECVECEVCETCEPCEVCPEEPSFEPLKTSFEVRDFAVGELFPCVYEGDDPDVEYRYQSTDDFPLPLDEYGYYGYPSTTVRPDATGRLVPASGHQVWRLIVDPNNGWIQELVCDYNTFPDKCPKDENGEYIWIRESPFDNPDAETYQALPTGDSMTVGYVAFSECNSIEEWVDI